MPTDPPAACPNCREPFGQPRPRFCPACGQESNPKPPTLAEFAQQFGGAYLSTEGALWRTLKLLVLQPGELTRQYLAGRRKHYVLPLRLYLTVSVAALLLVKLLAAPLGAVDVHGPAHGQGHAEFDIDLGFVRARLHDGVFSCEQAPAWLCARLKRRIDIEPGAVQREVAAYGERFIGNLGAALFVLVPAFAAALKLAWRRRRWRYTEHLVVALHLHAFGFLALALMLAPWEGFDTAVGLAATAHTLLALKRIYGGRWGWLLVRAGLVSTLYLATLAITLAVLAVWSIVF